MSHTTTIKTQFKDEAMIIKTCKELGIDVPIRGKHKLFDGKTIDDGLAVKLKGWSYPVVINTKSGEAFFDNYGGSWGEQVHLDKFTHHYAVNKAESEARRLGYMVTRQPAKNGGLNLTVTGFK